MGVQIGFMIRAHRGIHPKVAASAYIDPSAQVIGDVEVGERASIWRIPSVLSAFGTVPCWTGSGPLSASVVLQKWLARSV